MVYSGHKVALQRLRERLVLMALLSLAEDGYISLREDNRWSLRIFRIEIRSTEATITREKEAGELPPSLERAIMDALSGDPEGNRVRDVVARADRECGGVLSCVISALAEAGYLDWVPEAGLISGYTVRWCADEEAVAPLAGEVVILKATLEAFRRANPRLYHLLLGEIHDVYKSSW